MRLAPLKPVAKFHSLSIRIVCCTLSPQASLANFSLLHWSPIYPFPETSFSMSIHPICSAAKLISLKPSSDLVNHNWKMLNEFLWLKTVVLKCCWTSKATGELLNIRIPKAYSNLIRSESCSSRLGWEWAQALVVLQQSRQFQCSQGRDVRLRRMVN